MDDWHEVYGAWLTVFGRVSLPPVPEHRTLRDQALLDIQEQEDRACFEAFGGGSFAPDDRFLKIDREFLDNG